MYQKLHIEWNWISSTTWSVLRPGLPRAICTVHEVRVVWRPVLYKSPHHHHHRHHEYYLNIHLYCSYVVRWYVVVASSHFDLQFTIEGSRPASRTFCFFPAWGRFFTISCISSPDSGVKEYLVIGWERLCQTFKGSMRQWTAANL